MGIPIFKHTPIKLLCRPRVFPNKNMPCIKHSSFNKFTVTSRVKIKVEVQVWICKVTFRLLKPPKTTGDNCLTADQTSKCSSRHIPRNIWCINYVIEHVDSFQIHLTIILYAHIYIYNIQLHIHIHAMYIRNHTHLHMIHNFFGIIWGII